MLLFLALAVVSVFGLGRLRQEEDLMVFLPSTDPDVQLFREVAHRFGGLRVAMVGVEAEPGQDMFSGPSLERLQAATDAIKNVFGVDRLIALTTTKDIVAGPMGAQLNPLIPEPLPSTDAARDELRKRVMSRDHIVGAMISKDARAALIMVFLAEGVSDQQVTGTLKATALAKLSPMKVYFGGAPFAAEAIYGETQNDVRWLSPVALLVLLLVVVLSFRDPVGVVLTVVSVAFSVLVVLGGMGWFGSKFTVASSTLPVILFASGSTYAVHVLGRYYLLRAELDSAAAVQKALKIVGPPLLIAAGTTSVGFFSFVATDVEPMRAFGIAVGAGVLLCWLTSLTLVPAVLALWPRQSKPHRTVGVIGEWLVGVWHWSRRYRIVVGLGAVAASIACVRPMLKVGVRMDPSAFFRPGSDPWLAERFLDEKFGGAHFAQIDVKGDFDDPATLRELVRLEDYIGSLPGVTQVQAITTPLRLVNEAFGGGRRLPATPSQAANLFFFIEGEAGISSLIAAGRQEVLVNVRVRGDTHAMVEKLERFVEEGGLRHQPQLPTADDVAERVGWILRARTGHDPADPARLQRVMRLLAAPGDADPEWTRQRAELTRAWLDGEEAPPNLPREKKDALLQLVTTGGDWKTPLVAASPSPEEGGLAVAALSGRLDDARRTLAVERALPQVLEAAGLHGAEAPELDRTLDGQLRSTLDDLFVPRWSEPPRRPLYARVAGEPILERGFSRSVENNQWRSLGISTVAVLLMLFALFRSVRVALVCMAPSVVTMIALFGVMGLLSLKIDLGTSLVAGITTGAGADFAMHYLWYLRSQPADDVSRSVGPVMVVGILLVSLGFVVLALGKSPVMHLFGTLAGAAMAVSALLTCLLVPALLKEFGPPVGPTEARRTL